MNNQLKTISLVVVILVVFFYAVAFFMSFRKSSNFETKAVQSKNLDEELAEAIVKENKEYFLGQDRVDVENGKKKKLSLKEYRVVKEKQKKRSNHISNFFLGIIYVIVGGFMVLGIYLRVNNEQLFYKGYSYLVIETGSMSKKNQSNSYLFDPDDTKNYNMDNQILVFDLIQLQKMNGPEDIKKYDVVAYRDDENNIIVHRVIDINTDPETGIVHFRFRGDANNGSTTYERNGHDGTGLGLTFDDFVGKYTGWSNYGLGITIDYLRSDIGLICLVSGLVVVGIFYAFDDKMMKVYNGREAYIVDMLDESSDRRFKWYLVEYRSSKKYKALTEGIYQDGNNVPY